MHERFGPRDVRRGHTRRTRYLRYTFRHIFSLYWSKLLSGRSGEAIFPAPAVFLWGSGGLGRVKKAERRGRREILAGGSFPGGIDRGRGDLAGTGGWILDDRQRTLARVDSALEWACVEDRAGLVRLLDLVRIEVLFDVNSPHLLPPARVTLDGMATGANRGT